jgi:hypothetical protein
LRIQHERGYLVVANNSDHTNYVDCAIRLAQSLKHWHPHCKTAVLTNVEDVVPFFDLQLKFPNGGGHGQKDDWQCWHVTPFRQTIKLESDMLVTSSIDHWWSLFEHRDVVVSTGCRDFYGQESSYRGYRKLFDENALPDVYNAITYWRRSETAMKFWQWVQEIFDKWPSYRELLKFPDLEPTTDVVYAMVAKIMGEHLVTMPFSSYPKIVHMKKHINPFVTNNWTNELVIENLPWAVKINTVAQWGCLHYQEKSWHGR